MKVMKKTQEERFLEIIKDYSVEFSIDTFEFCIYDSKGYYLMDNMWCSYYSFKHYFSEYNISIHEGEDFIKRMVLKYLNLKIHENESYK